MALQIDYPSWGLFYRALLVLLVGVVGRFCITLYHVRHKFQVMQKAGLVSLSISCLWPHCFVPHGILISE